MQGVLEQAIDMYYIDEEHRVESIEDRYTVTPKTLSILTSMVMRSAPPNTVGIALSFGGVINSTYPWLRNRPLGHVYWFSGCRDMAKSKQ